MQNTDDKFHMYNIENVLQSFFFHLEFIFVFNCFKYCINDDILCLLWLNVTFVRCLFFVSRICKPEADTKQKININHCHYMDKQVYQIEFETLCCFFSQPEMEHHTINSAKTFFSHCQLLIFMIK